jgi:Peptidase family M23
MRRSSKVTALIAAAVALAPAAAQAAPKRTPLFMTLQTPPAPVLGTDGRRHLAYEFTLANDTRTHAEVESLAVRAKGGRTLLTLTGAQIRQVMANFAFQPTNALEANEGGRLWLDVTLPHRGRLPRALVHRLTVRTEARTFTFDTTPTPVDPRRPIVVSPPLRGGLYINFNGCCGVSAHRAAFTAMDGRTFLSERFAIDLIQVDAQGVAAAGDITKNESFFTFGEPVLAVADARVVSTVNDVPENVPLNEPPASGFSERDILGNHVILDLGHGRYAAYGHLQTGSVRVHVGETVRRGQVLARVGNTGPSGGAHLHFQIADGRDPLASEGLPFVFRRFSLAGEVTNIDAFLTGAANANIQPAQHAGRRQDELPLHSSVVRFAG